MSAGFFWNQQNKIKKPALQNKSISLFIAWKQLNALTPVLVIITKQIKKIMSVMKETNAWEEMTMIESFGFVEMYLMVPLTLWKTVKSKLAALSEVAMLVGGCT